MKTLIGISLPLSVALALGARANESEACRKTAIAADKACKDEAASEFWLARANCTNLPTTKERIVCALAAMSSFHDDLDECRDQREARVDICDELGGGIYHPDIDPKDFVEVVDNPYMPLLPGTTFVYESKGGKEIEHDEVAVTDATEIILGVTCTVVHDIVTVDDEVVEDTFDRFAQDVHGNVWYFGEISQQFEDGELIGIEGSWKAGRDGAQPGIVMQAHPKIGSLYRQEFLIAEAEDVALVQSLSAHVSVPYGSFDHCLQTEDFSALEPGAIEHKFYALGVGNVLETNPETGERVELVAIQMD